MAILEPPPQITNRDITRATLRLFWRASFQQKWSLWLAYIGRLPSFFLQNTIVPLAVAYGLQAIVEHRFNAVAGYAWSVLWLTVLAGLLLALGTWAVARNAIVAGEYVQRAVFANYLDKDYEFYGNTYYGALGAQAVRLRDAASDYGKLVTLDIPKEVITVGTGLVVIGFSSLPLAAITLVCMLFVLSYTMWSSRWRVRHRRKLSEVSSVLAGVIGDALTHSVTVKSFAAEGYEQGRLDEALKPWAKAQFASWTTSIPADVGRNTLAAVTIAILLLMTASLYHKGTISFAVVALVQLYVLRMIAVTQDIAETVKAYETAMGSCYQSVKTMLIEPTVADSNDPVHLPMRTAPHELRCHNIRFAYDGNKKKLVIKDFSLTVKQGEKVGLVGYSGSGKTTLTKLILRFLDVERGSIEIDGIPINTMRQQELRRLIAYVPQEPLLFHRSIAENIVYGNPSANRKALLAAARMAHVDEFAEDLPDKYETLVGERGVKLSGGQRQRVAIARAIIKDSPILILDEATSALDSKSEKLIQKALWNLMKDRTALVIAHRLSTIQRMDRIAVIDKGKLVQIGTHDELLREPAGIYATLWAHQSGGYIGEPK
jgi:ATP-binding cassette subfamily B protein